MTIKQLSLKVKHCWRLAAISYKGKFSHHQSLQMSNIQYYEELTTNIWSEKGIKEWDLMTQIIYELPKVDNQSFVFAATQVQYDMIVPIIYCSPTTLINLASHQRPLKIHKGISKLIHRGHPVNWQNDLDLL